MPGTVDRQSLDLFIKNLFGDDLSDVAAAIEERGQLLGPSNFRPIDRAIAPKDPHPSVSRQAGINLAHCPQKFFVEGTLPGIRTL